MISDVMTGIEFWLVVVGTGALVWLARQIIPDNIENSKLWQVLLKVVPAFVGAGIACIPQMRPVSDNIVQSAFFGLIGGTMSQTVYGLVREIAPEKVRLILGSKASRNSSVSSISPPKDDR